MFKRVVTLLFLDRRGSILQNLIWIILVLLLLLGFAGSLTGIFSQRGANLVNTIKGTP